MKAAEFIRKHLVPAGAVLLRKRGDHHVYLLNGTRFNVPVGGSQTEMTQHLVWKFNKVTRRAA